MDILNLDSHKSTQTWNLIVEFLIRC